ncbi:MAG: DoxX family protein [Hydrogenophaga sp.]|jgi:putative oxidoreductase|uniref:DoxX family protein n=1 Tax=Hydrogenophaga sp. TaxID=1904254 RepID=UPI00260B03A7|nr:DoxX family protein [Hydrogenophaga sp.]MCW5672714.1 DoxX family protein [Hydrogenophaga sp.]
MNTLSHTLRATESIRHGLERWISHDLIALAARLGIAGIFWLSGRTKVEGWFTLTDTTFLLFREDYALPLIPPEWAAYLATSAEHLFPILLVLGLATRLSAAALLGMTAVIQFLVYPAAWPTHLTWAVPLLYLLGRGAGRCSLDALLLPRREG